jgi:hypothetical protein
MAMAEQISQNLAEHGTSLEDFVVSTDRLLKDAMLNGDIGLVADLVRRTARLCGVAPEVAFGFVLGRASKEIDKAVKELEGAETS